MAEAVETMDGWYCLHDLRKIDWNAWKKASIVEQEAAITELQSLLTKWDVIDEEKTGSHAVYSILGHKADVLFMILRPTLKELQEAELAFNKSAFASFMQQTYSYVSIVELSKYTAKEGENPEEHPGTQARLRPRLPKWDHICFYPMDKRRQGNDNWYVLPMDERRRLMYEHSKTGRKYAGKIRQIITGSMGFDDWEWSVTLFAKDALDIKKLVYEMRFDEVSARFGEFGAFYVGNILVKEDIPTFMEV
ncbi:hydrogen peroxide-dependent heme synthase [Paraliobacillus salinarum]|uniref:hydrogen peroxide-dependent heme synthase n=1 Tax=Paraliobacillus salinarum TaxID=1158996 RepID=UPI0015F3A8A9|nr:hydrogen peroxide-dependent heme synthase [Paraliobacillus salinarum]